MNSITHSQFIGCIVCGSCKGVSCSSPGSKNDVSFCSPQLRSVLTLVSYRTKMIDATEQGWVQKLAGFMDKFYRYGLEEDITCKQAFSQSLSFSPSSLTPPPSSPPFPGGKYVLLFGLKLSTFLLVYWQKTHSCMRQVECMVWYTMRQRCVTAFLLLLLPLPPFRMNSWRVSYCRCCNQWLGTLTLMFGAELSSYLLTLCLRPPPPGPYIVLPSSTL